VTLLTQLTRVGKFVKTYYLMILKHTHDLSDEDLCARWVENPYFQLFCDGMDGAGASMGASRSPPSRHSAWCSATSERARSIR
jgi:Transposase domain (DUF772)